MTIYQKVIAAYGILRSAINGRMSKYDVAQEFRDSATYAVGRLVIHDDKLYRCTTAHTGPWDANDFVQSTVEEAIIYEIDRAVLAASAEFAEKTDIASEFSSTQRYDVDRLVVYENVLYRCSVAHPAGEWNGDHFVQATVDDVIALNGGLKNIADDFDKTKSYSVGQLVVYYNKLYRCVTDHSGPWNIGHFTLSTVNGALDLKASTSSLSYKADMSNLAHPFSSTETYHVGQLVVYNNTLFRCTTIHKGNWNEDHFTVSTVGDAMEYYGNYSNVEIPGGGTINIGAVPNGCVRTIRIYESGESAPGAHLSVALPSTEPEFEDFSVYNARLVIDALDIDGTLVPTISFGSPSNGDVVYTPSGSEQLHVSNGCLNVFDISFCGSSNLGKMWLVRMVEANEQ